MTWFCGGSDKNVNKMSRFLHVRRCVLLSRSPLSIFIPILIHSSLLPLPPEKHRPPRPEAAQHHPEHDHQPRCHHQLLPGQATTQRKRLPARPARLSGLHLPGCPKCVAPEAVQGEAQRHLGPGRRPLHDALQPVPVLRNETRRPVQAHQVRGLQDSKAHEGVRGHAVPDQEHAAAQPRPTTDGHQDPRADRTDDQQQAAVLPPSRPNGAGDRRGESQERTDNDAAAAIGSRWSSSGRNSSVDSGAHVRIISSQVHGISLCSNSTPRGSLPVAETRSHTNGRASCGQ